MSDQPIAITRKQLDEAFEYRSNRQHDDIKANRNVGDDAGYVWEYLTKPPLVERFHIVDENNHGYSNYRTKEEAINELGFFVKSYPGYALRIVHLREVRDE